MAYCETFATISQGGASQEGQALIHGKETLSTFEMLIMCQKSNEESSDCHPISMSRHLQMTIDILEEEG